jgi:DNA ligase (NAD+)
MPVPACMRELVDLLNKANYQYYVLDAPVMADAQWDGLYDELLKLENQTGIRLPDSPSRRVGGEPLPAFQQHRHLSRLWSLDKVQNEEELLQWFARTRALHQKTPGLPPLLFALEYKFDGLTINLTYRQGFLVQAATRGNGVVGEIVLPQVQTIRGIPLSIPYQGLMEIHGECLMSLSFLAHYNRTADEPLKNARNAAAGALRNLDPKVTASRRLEARFYEIGTISSPPYQDQEGLSRFIAENGIPDSPILAVSGEETEILDGIQRIEAEREALDFLIDGAVIKITDLATREALGYTDKFPRWAVAYKFAAEEATATLERVTWEIGRTGKLTPLAHLSPVDFSGVTVRKATLNNFGDIVRKGLSLGSTVWLRRSNDVIPEILGKVDDGLEGESIIKPELCPACGSELSEVGAHLFCLNRACKPQVIARLTHFCSRDAMNIESLSEKTLETLHEYLGVREPQDLYALLPAKLIGLPGFQEKKVEKLMDALQVSRDCQLDAFLFAIGIPNIGRATARDIALAFGTLGKVRTAKLDELTAIPSVGEVVAGSILQFFAQPVNQEMIAALISSGVVPRDMPQAASGGVLQGRNFVLTGNLPGLSRQQAEDLISRHGGIISTSVSRKTSYLLLGENPGSKLGKAQSLGIPILDEGAFMALVNNQ